MLKNQEYPDSPIIQHSKKKLDIKLHHLSRLTIILNFLLDEPQSIDVSMWLTNYLSFPSQDMKKNIITNNEIAVSMIKRDDDSIELGYSYLFIVNGITKKSDLDGHYSNILTLHEFYNWFRKLESYINAIEGLNSKLIELKKSKHNLPLINNVSHGQQENVTKNTYRKRVKELKAERAMIQRKIVDFVSRLFK